MPTEAPIVDMPILVLPVVTFPINKLQNIGESPLPGGLRNC